MVSIIDGILGHTILTAVKPVVFGCEVLLTNYEKKILILKLKLKINKFYRFIVKH